MASVVSAAVVSGELIIGLDDGSIIRAGYVQGPQGLKGDQGPMGATGGRGQDGNTLHTVEGTPDGSLGKDGDYAINRIDWRIHGPKAGGRWPQGVDMLAKGKGSKQLGGKGSGGSGVTGGGGSSGGGPGGDVFTNQVFASGTGRLVEVPVVGSSRARVQYPGSPNGIIPPSAPMTYQSNINAFFVDALDQLDMAMPVPTTDDPPTTDIYEGKLWFDSDEDELTLYIYYGGEWVPAAPPVSLDGIEGAIGLLTEKVSVVETGVVQARVDIAGNAGEIEALKKDIEEGKFRPDLEQVLEQGNVADKNIVLTDGTDDLIDISSAEGRIVIASDADAKTPKLTLAHFGDHQDGNRKADIELDENGTRLDFEMSDFVKDVHFRFGKEEKFIINHVGDAVFTGKVQAQPATQNDELVTYDQLTTVAADVNQNTGEIEDINNKIDELARIRNAGRWRWVADGSPSSPNNGEFTLLKAGGAQPVRDWTEATTLVIAEVDYNGLRHDVGTWGEDDRIEVFSDDPSMGFAVYRLGETPQGSRDTMRVIASCEVSENLPVDGIVYRVRRYEGSTIDIDSADERYVNVTGDTMNGDLSFKKTGDGEYWSYIRAQKPKAWDTSQQTHGLILDVGTTNTYKQQFKIQGRSGRELFKVFDDNGAQATLGGNLNATGALKVGGKDVATKEYVDAAVNASGGSSSVLHPGLGLGWRFETGQTDNPESGKFGFLGYFGSNSRNQTLSISATPKISPNGTNFVELCKDPLPAHDCRSIMTIYEVSSQGVYTIQAVYQIFQMTYGAQKNNGSKYIKVEVNHTAVVKDLVAGTDYFITIGGLF